jgi:hypothetical protein
MQAPLNWVSDTAQPLLCWNPEHSDLALPAALPERLEHWEMMEQTV